MVKFQSRRLCEAVWKLSYQYWAAVQNKLKFWAGKVCLLRLTFLGARSGQLSCSSQRASPAPKSKLLNFEWVRNVKSLAQVINCSSVQIRCGTSRAIQTRRPGTESYYVFMRCSAVFNRVFLSPKMLSLANLFVFFMKVVELRDCWIVRLQKVCAP